MTNDMCLRINSIPKAMPWAKSRPRPFRAHQRQNNTKQETLAINEIVNEHLEVDWDATMVAESRRFDISGIDFELLRREFAKSREKNLVLKDIQELLQERIAQMLAQNPSRINFYEKYQEIIHYYNQEQNRATIEKTFEELMSACMMEVWHQEPELVDKNMGECQIEQIWHSPIVIESLYRADTYLCSVARTAPGPA